MFQPAAPVAALMLAAAPAAPLAWDVWSSTFLALVCLSQQFHAWSHMKPSELHPAVVALQVGWVAGWVGKRGRQGGRPSGRGEVRTG